MTLLFGVVSGILMDLTRHRGDPPGVLGEISMGIVDWLLLQPLIYAGAGNTDATARVLILLGELLRQLLRSDAPQEIPLREELALLETYLEIQRVRLGDRLHVTWDIDEDVRDALVPQLVLQPLVASHCSSVRSTPQP
jgi:hypothetical protein